MCFTSECNFRNTKMTKIKRRYLLVVEFLAIIICQIQTSEAKNSPDTQQQPFHLLLLSSGNNDKASTINPATYYTFPSPKSASFSDKLVADVDYFDKLSVDSQLSNKQFVETQIRCLIYDGQCDFFGRKAKELLPSIILDNCRLCTETQKNKLTRVVVHLQQHHPGPWRDALLKYGSSPRFITAGQVVPGATFFGVQHHHKKPHTSHYQADDNLGVVHFRSSSPAPYYNVQNVNPVIPTPQTSTMSHESSDYATDGYATASSDGQSTQQTYSYSPNHRHHPHLMTMSSTLVIPNPVLASISATSTSPIPEQLHGVVESPPINPTASMMQGNYMDSTTTPYYDLRSSSSSVQPPSTSVVESTIEIKPTTLEPYHYYSRN